MNILMNDKKIKHRLIICILMFIFHSHNGWAKIYEFPALNEFTKITKKDNNLKAIQLIYSIRGKQMPLEPISPGAIVVDISGQSG
jgi:hypothetical protein